MLALQSDLAGTVKQREKCNISDTSSESLRGRPLTHELDNVTSWTGLSEEAEQRRTLDRKLSLKQSTVSSKMVEEQTGHCSFSPFSVQSISHVYQSHRYQRHHHHHHHRHIHICLTKSTQNKT